MSLPTGPRIFSTASLRLMPCTGSPSIATMRSPGLSPACAAGVSSIGETTLTSAVLHRDLDAEAAELALHLHLHVAEVLGVHVARMRIERGQHAVDRRLDELLVGDLLDIIGAHPLEHLAEQIELAVGVGIGRGGVACGVVGGAAPSGEQQKQSIAAEAAAIVKRIIRLPFQRVSPATAAG